MLEPSYINKHLIKNPGPCYEIPSKIIERPGKTFGIKHNQSVSNVPGPGNYNPEKLKKHDLKYS